MVDQVRKKMKQKMNYREQNTFKYFKQYFTFYSVQKISEMKEVVSIKRFQKCY
jgi:hypothetical protein